jgi:integrase
MADGAKAKRSYGSGSIVEWRGAWYGKWRVGDRQVKRKLGQIRRPGSTEGLTAKQAEVALRRLMGEVRVVAPEARVTLGEAGRRYLDHLRAVGRKPSTLGEYESMFRVHLEPALGSAAVDRIGPADIERYVGQKVGEGKAAKTVRNHLGLLHSIFGYAERRGWSRGNPCKQVDAPRVETVDAEVRFLDQTELAALLRAVESRARDIEVPASGRTERSDSLRRMYQLDRVLYLSAALTGLRQGELLGLRWRDIDWTASRVRVRRAWVRGQMGTPKSRRSSRSVPLASTVARELELHFQRSAYQHDDDLVFAHPDTGAPLDRSKLLKRFKAAAREAGLREIRFHDLRHTFGTRMAAAGTPMRTLQEWMGHRDIKTTQVYADYAPSEREAELVERAFGTGLGTEPHQHATF